VITEYWTLDTLFPPAQATTAWTEDPQNAGVFIPNGHAIVASSSTSLRNRRTRLYMPNTISDGINFSAAKILYITNNQWHDANTNLPLDSDLLLLPDHFITVSHPSTVAQQTTFRTSGEVELGNFSIPLHSISSGAQDNHLAAPRPIDLRVDQLNLISSNSFVASDGTSLRNRKDVLFLYDNTQPNINRSADVILYHDGVTWRNANDNSEASQVIVPASSGFVIRKARTDVATTSFWQNNPTY